MAGEDPLAAARPGEGGDAGGLTDQLAARLAGEGRADVPQPQVRVERARRERRAVGREGERPDGLVVAQADRHLLGLRHVPQVHDPVHVGGGEERAVGREAEAEGRRVVAGAAVQVGAQHVGAVARAQVPEPDGAVGAGHGQQVGHRRQRRLLRGGRLAERAELAEGARPPRAQRGGVERPGRHGQGRARPAGRWSACGAGRRAPCA